MADRDEKSGEQTAAQSDEKGQKPVDAPGEATQIGGMAPPPVAPPPAAPKPGPKAAPPAPASPPGGEDAANPEATQIGGVAPPPAVAPPSPAARPPSEPNPEATQIGGAAPPPAVPPAAAPGAPAAPPGPPASAPGSDATQIGGVAPPPVTPGAPPAAGPPGGTAPAKAPTYVPEAGDTGDPDRTVIAGTSDATVVGRMGSADATVVAGIDSATVAGSGFALAAPASLVRLTPPEHKGEVVALDPTRSDYALGRHEASDIVLYTPTAGRQHARISRGQDGRWYLRPAPDKEVRLGRRSSGDDVALTNGLKISLGDDQFQVRTESSGSEGGASLDLTKAVLYGVIGLLVVAIAAVLLLR